MRRSRDRRGRSNDPPNRWWKIQRPVRARIKPLIRTAETKIYTPFENKRTFRIVFSNFGLGHNFDLQRSLKLKNGSILVKLFSHIFVVFNDIDLIWVPSCLSRQGISMHTVVIFKGQCQNLTSGQGHVVTQVLHMVNTNSYFRCILSTFHFRSNSRHMTQVLHNSLSLCRAPVSQTMALA